MWCWLWPRPRGPRTRDGSGRGLVLASEAVEVLEAVVTKASSQSNQCEPLRVPEQPLDVLCQQLVGMACNLVEGKRTRRPALVRQAYPFRLAGLGSGVLDRLPCVTWQAATTKGATGMPPRADQRRWARRGEWSRVTRVCLRRNLGTILAEEALTVERTAPAAPESEEATVATIPVGEVAEAFADRLQPGDRFLLDGRCLEYRRRQGNALQVEEVPGRPAVPRWGGEGLPLSPELARRLYVLRIRAAEALREGPAALAALLCREYDLGERGVDSLAAYFQRQESVSEIPEENVCLIEALDREFGANWQWPSTRRAIAPPTTPCSASQVHRLDNQVRAWSPRPWPLAVSLNRRRSWYALCAAARRGNARYAARAARCRRFLRRPRRRFERYSDATRKPLSPCTALRRDWMRFAATP